MRASARRQSGKTGELDAYMYLMWGEGAMELSVASVDHFNHISLTNALHLMKIELDISLFAIFGPAGTRASAKSRGHGDCFFDYSSGSDTSVML